MFEFLGGSNENQHPLSSTAYRVWQWIVSTVRAVQWYVVTFVTGAVLALALLLVPLYYDSYENSQVQPVTLFETILADLDAAYVEPIDAYQLFETGMAAMLNSLDPYTEFENIQEAVEMTESIEGKYGGVGLVISGVNNNEKDNNNNPKSTVATTLENGSDTDTDENDDVPTGIEKLRQRAKQQGIRVVTAFEGYAFDYGMRVGDKLVRVDSLDILPGSTTVEQVRNTLRGEPGTPVHISFERDGVDGVQSVTMPRSLVQIRDVKLASMIGDPSDGVGYIQLSGFAADAGKEVKSAIAYLQRAAEDASHGERPLQGLVLDLRGNPGGLLTSAVDVASLLVPKGSDIVSAQGRGFPSILYRSRVDPILDAAKTKLVVLVNGNTASAAEIVSGAVQDLDVGVIVGSDRTFGKGLVQNVEELPFHTALKFTVAKYYTPSGRCIQGVNYYQRRQEEDGGQAGKFVAKQIAEKDQKTFYTRTGRVVHDGGGIEADYKVELPKASPLEVTLLRSGGFTDFAAEWSKKHELTNNFAVDEETYKEFQTFVNDKQKNGELELEALYGEPLKDLKKALQASGYKGSEKSVEALQARIVRDIQNDFDKYRTEIKEDISQSILARYLPESMLIERGIKNDPQVRAAAKLIASRNNFDKILARGNAAERKGAPPNSFNVAAQSEQPAETNIQAAADQR